MDAAADFIDFVPDRSQLARVAAPQAKTPPVWVAVAAVAGALGLSLSMALPPATQVRGGGITSRTAIEEARTESPSRSGEIFQLPAWHEEADER